MADHKGDKLKQPPECTVDRNNRCPNIKCISETMGGERWCCLVCGEEYYLDYDEMK